MNENIPQAVKEAIFIFAELETMGTYSPKWGSYYFSSLIASSTQSWKEKIQGLKKLGKEEGLVISKKIESGTRTNIYFRIDSVPFDESPIGRYELGRYLQINIMECKEGRPRNKKSCRESNTPLPQITYLKKKIYYPSHIDEVYEKQMKYNEIKKL